jgi:hypothetical protein
MAKYQENYTEMARTLKGINRIGWNSKNEQWMRFKALTDLITTHVGPIPDLTIHDAGCGFADLLTHWKDAPPKSYVGSDCIRPFIDEAKARHPAADIRLLDSLKQTPPAADVSVLCGMLSMHTADNQIAIMEKMRLSSRKAILFTMWTGPSQGERWWEVERRLLTAFTKGQPFFRNQNVYDMSEHMYLLPTV